MISRRGFIAAGASSALLGARTLTAATTADDRLRELLDRQVGDLLIQYPEEATGMERDVGAFETLRGRLGDRSIAAMQRESAMVMRARLELGRIKRAELSANAALEYDVADFVYETLADMLGRYGYVDLDLRPSPYVVSQMNGAYYWLSGFLGTTHPLRAKADVEAWFSRLEALSAVLDQETERVRHDAALGVEPPDFVIAHAVSQIKQLRDMPPRKSALIAGAVERAQSVGLGDIGPRGEEIIRQSIVPALTRQANALEALLPHASKVAGVWRLPDGAAYYSAALRANTTIGVLPGELHREGLEQCANLHAEMDTVLRAQGFSGGSVNERLAALNTDTRFLVTEDDAGRARIVAEAEKQLGEIVNLLPQAFNAPIVDPLTVRRVPLTMEDGAPLAFYDQGIDGNPGALMLNLKRTQDLPLWRLATLVHHEGVPGHHFQSSMVRRTGGLSLFRRMVRFSSYTEGYALYAQQLADELGVFEGNPFGRIGHLQSELFRAARIVVDTGLHHKRWTRKQAIEWMVQHAGEVPATTEREVMRYSVYPGQACSFKVGANAIVSARESARRRLGARFDLRRFHDLVLRSGPMPMGVLSVAVSRMN
jgi:uncharacterized protein (DUF885 family)